MSFWFLWMANTKKNLGPFDLAVRMVLASILLKMIVFFASKQFTFYESVAIFINIFILLTGVFLGIWNYRKSIGKSDSFISYVKEGMKVAAFYAILMTAFVYIYYSFIDPSYFEIKLAKQLELASKNDLNVKQVKEMGEVVLSPFFQSTITLIGFLLLGSFYSSIVTFLLRKFKPGF